MVDMDSLELEMNNCVDRCSSHFNKYPEIRFWEILGGVQVDSGFRIEKGYIKSSEIIQANAVTIRVYGSEGNIGSASGTSFTQDEVKKLIDYAAKMMKVSLPNPEFHDLARPPPSYPEVKKTWDSSLQSLRIEDTEDIAKGFINQYKRDPKIISVSGGFGYGDARVKVMNSNGVNVKDRGTHCLISIEYTMEDLIKGSKVNSNGSESQNYIYFKSLKQEMNSIFDMAYEKAVKGLNKIDVETGSYPVVLSPYATGILIEQPIADGINGELIYQKRSFLLEKLNKQISSDELTLIDNPWLEDGLSTCAFDCEGTPTKPMTLVENGVLNSYIHNTYSAHLLKTTSTGHAVRDWYSASIGIDVSNVMIQPGDIPKEEMISSIKKGIYFDATYDSPNIVTGEFSGLITSGYLIEDGQIGRSLRESMFGADLLDLYSKIKQVSKETKRLSSSYLPYILISDMMISGAGEKDN